MNAGSGRGTGESLTYQQIAADLQKIGVKLEIELRPPSRQMLDMFAGKIDADMVNMFTRGNDPIVDYRHRACLNLMQARAPMHCDPAIAEVAHRAMAEQDLDKRKSLYAQVAKMERNSPPGILLWQGVEFDALGPKVKRFAPALDIVNAHEWEVK